jgi:6-phosphofructokinase 2
MHTIATLTLNPALDISTETERVLPTEKLRCGPARFEPGGGGINVARVITVLGGRATAVYPAGGPAGAMLKSSLDARGIDQRVVPIAGMTRESISVDESSTGKQFRFVLPGPDLSAAEVSACLHAVTWLDPSPAYLVLSGGPPPNVAPGPLNEEIGRLARRIGARLVLDTSQAIRFAPAHGVYLMKPNAEELCKMVGHPCDSLDEQAAAARGLVRDGRAEVVVVSIGAKGALLVTADLVQHFPTPAVKVASAVGAGDSMVGAMVLALDRGMSLVDAVRYGVAAGAATLMTPGTELCHRHDVERLFRTVAPVTLAEAVA